MDKLLINLLILLSIAAIAVADDDDASGNINRRRLLALQRASIRHREQERLRFTTCTNSETLPQQQHIQSNHGAVSRKRRSIAADVETPTPGGNNVDRSVLFTGESGVLEWINPAEFTYPSGNFTVEAWVKAEGGQSEDVSFLGELM